ncbi:MAG: hypothetical protein AB7O97_18275 [Planctomycetota bacterium]
MPDEPFDLSPLEPDEDELPQRPAPAPGALSPGRARELRAQQGAAAGADLPVPARAPAPGSFLLDDVDDVPAPDEPPRPWWPMFWRVGAVYLLLYCLPFPLEQLFGGGDGSGGHNAVVDAAQSVRAGWDDGKRAVVAWFAQLVTGEELTVFTNGSGDTSYDWFAALATMLVALFVGALWHLLRRPREPGPRARDLLRVYARYWLGAWLIFYGLHKAIPLQFGTLRPSQLLATYGESSPMNLLWTFMAASPAYTMFVGVAELLAGVLLLWRSTALLGALMAAAVLVNVAMLNLCYDVPVKLFSLHLLAVAVLLSARDLGRLVDMFVRNRGAAPVSLWPWPEAGWVRWPVLVLKVLFVAWLLYVPTSSNISALLDRLEPQEAPSGTWAVETFTRGDEEVAPFTEPERWRRIDISIGERFSRAHVVRADGGATSYVIAVDAAAGTMTWSPIAGPEEQAPPPFDVSWSQSDPKHLQIRGAIGGAQVVVDCALVDPAAFPLTTRGFRWVSERPFNQHR